MRSCTLWRNEKSRSAAPWHTCFYFPRPELTPLTTCVGYYVIAEVAKARWLLAVADAIEQHCGKCSMVKSPYNGSLLCQAVWVFKTILNFWKLCLFLSIRQCIDRIGSIFLNKKSYLFLICQHCNPHGLPCAQNFFQHLLKNGIAHLGDAPVWDNLDWTTSQSI